MRKKILSRLSKNGIIKHLKRGSKMSNMDSGLIQIGKAKEFFELGLVTGFHIERAIQPGKWFLVIVGTELRAWTLATKLNEMKVFSSVDTLIGQAEQIAGREIEAWVASPVGRPLHRSR